MNTPSYIFCPHCMSCDISTIEKDSCWWYECNSCGHALTYEEVMEQEKNALETWMKRQLEFNRGYQDLFGGQ